MAPLVESFKDLRESADEVSKSLKSVREISDEVYSALEKIRDNGNRIGGTHPNAASLFQHPIEQAKYHAENIVNHMKRRLSF